MMSSDLDYFVEVTNAIEAGRFDGRLPQMYKSLQARTKLVGKVSLVSEFSVGDSVMVNDRCALAYLRGESATVVGVDYEKVHIRFLEPKGEFLTVLSDGSTLDKVAKVAPDLLDKIE